MWPVSDFEVTLWTSGSEPALHFVTRSTAEVSAALDAPGPLFLEVYAHQRRPGQVDLSLADLQVWLNGEGMAWIRLLEHREHTPSDPARTRMTGEVGGFPDEGGTFAVPAAEAITVQQAARVLDHWLDCGGKLPGLTWS